MNLPMLQGQLKTGPFLYSLKLGNVSHKTPPIDLIKNSQINLGVNPTREHFNAVLKSLVSNPDTYPDEDCAVMGYLTTNNNTILQIVKI